MTAKTLMKSMKKELIYIPMPTNINLWWNFGSLIASCLVIQILSGLILSMTYCASMEQAFNSIIHIGQDTFLGWIPRSIHINGASMFFLFIFIHITRGLYQFSFKLIQTWFVGVIIFIMSMTAAFLGYILPWGQMSFWGATVITNLISVIPYIGQTCVEWVWGGFSVGGPTLSRFYTLHFLLPMIISMMVIIHLTILHLTGSSNPAGTPSNLYMVPFHPYFSIKDLVGVMLLLTLILIITLMHPDMLIDPDNYIMANPLVTPTHIKPEWYFLYAYAILRSIPNKLGGVVCLLSSILILLVPTFLNSPKMPNMKFYPTTSMLFWVFINIVSMLTWLGAKPVESPYIQMSQLLSMLYFLYFLTFHYPSHWYDKKMLMMNLM